jgi:hypothetical protein
MQERSKMGVGISGEGYTLEEHGAAYHTNLTRHFFVYPNDAGSGTQGNYGQRFIGVLLDANAEYCFGSFVYPLDFEAVGLIKLAWVREAAAGTVDATFTAYWAAHDEPYTTGSNESANVALDAIGNADIGITDTGLNMVGADDNDIITLKAARSVASEDNFRVLGWIVEYTANQ